MALGLHFGAQPAGTVALAVICKGLAHGYLPSRLYCPHLLVALPGTVRAKHDAQDMADLTHGHVARPLGDILTGPAG